MRLNCWMFAVSLIPLISVGECSWGAPGEGQYHIQTDEGPERYFRFQTDNGQFRKEKRLQDGTVIGTEAWIDAAGFLRQKDYIADKAGYRILKSKTIFVGHGTHIEDAIKSTKSAPAQSGVLVDGKNGLNSVAHANDVKHGGYVYSTTTTSTTTPLPPISSTIASNVIAAAAAEDAAGKLNYLSPAEAAKLEPTPHLGFDHYPDELPRLRQNLHHGLAREPIVHIRPHSEPIETHSNSIAEDEDDGDYAQAIGTTTYHPPLAPRPSTPSLSMQPPFESRRRVVRPVALINTRPPPISSQSEEGYGYSTPAPFLATTPHTPTQEGYFYQRAPTAATHEHGYAHTTPRPDLALAVNNLEEGLLPPLPRPTRRRLRPPHPHRDAGDTTYNGVSATRDGFRYFLPQHYHEEETFDEDKRAGSYGYVDPFGIRRVVYYNASPGRGFVHRNNNRYVGLGATPYDPVVSL